ncbi:MAG: helix-turn-helix transcriptional regulator [Desulfobacteraceae bacterium]|jgi:transcriptional regulator with XRE-family HTH domain
MSIKQKYGLKDLEKEYGPLTFGEALESYRLGEEISQADMARRIGISAQSLCDIEKSRRIPTPKRAVGIAQVIGEPEMFWIKLALQDALRKENLKFDVFLKPSVDHVELNRVNGAIPDL